MALAPSPLDAPSTTAFFFHTDHQGSVRALTDGSGQVAAHASYDAYGGIETRVGAIEQPFAHAGREHDPETGLTHYRARAYDPATGRFLQEDPIWFEAGDLNVYRLTWNNPLNWTDPSGMSAAGYGGSARIGLGLASGVPLAIAATYSGNEVWDFMQRSDRNVLSSIAANVNCTLHKVGSAFQAAARGDTITGFDKCGTTVLNEEAGEDPRPYEGQTPDDKPEDFDRIRTEGRAGFRDRKNGSYWEKDRTGHGGSKWKRWPTVRDRNSGGRDGTGRKSVRPDGSVR